ncbi:uncharacterized protein LOC107751039 [Sinocyclocheilus rhinocerous]|uniref:uncharacterized protein LOC107751039 n=1 Tax=Sinocyclocheilus rhinocerous TaxID=307959 RepID=UPI0007B86F97|nr:PREDICTED: uncharacterized protein LOC107751039 [Sinocyclocheilus rhinocerous]
MNSQLFGCTTLKRFVFSVIWVKNRIMLTNKTINKNVCISQNDLDNNTLRDQFSYLQEMMQGSLSFCFGDMTMGEHLIREFVNNTPPRVQGETRAEGLALTHLTSNDEVPFKILEHRIKTETDEYKRQHLIRKHEALHQTKAKIERTVEAISRCFALEDDSDEDYSQMDLHAFKTVAEHFRTTCFDWHEEEVNNTAKNISFIA